MMFRTREARTNTPAGFTLVEVVVVIVLLSVFSVLTLSGIRFFLERDRAQAVASELAGWLTAVRRAGERGSGCSVTIATGGSVAPTATMATTTADGAWANPCGLAALVPQAGPGTAFRIAADPATTFVFTPRGTVFVPGGNNTPIEISINSVQGGAARPPMRCVRITPPLGLIEVVNNRSAITGRCNP